MAKIPLHCLVLMVGPSGSGKSTLASNLFDAYEIISSDAIRQELVGDFRRQDINHLVFKEVHRRADLKLSIGERAVIDATHLNRRDRLASAMVATKYGVPVFYVVVNRPLEEKLTTGGWRLEVDGLIERHDSQFKSSEREILRGDGVATVIDSRVESFDVVKKLPWGDILDEIKKRGFAGIMAIGDVHGMREPLKNAIDTALRRNLFMLFLGDVLDYGPDPLECINLAYDNVVRGRAGFIIGNHERKIERWLQQSRKGEVKVRLSHGNIVTVEAIQALDEQERHRFEHKFTALMSLARNHFVVGDALFTHGAAEPAMFEIEAPRLSGKLESLALYGEVDPNNQFREDGYPNRIYEWTNRIPEGKLIVVGHDIRSNIQPLVVNGNGGGQTIFLDTGSGKGGRLTSALLKFTNTSALQVESFVNH